MNPSIPVLDHGYVQIVETWGSDERIIEAARMSTDKGFLGWHAESRWHCEQCRYTMNVQHNNKDAIVEHEPMRPTLIEITDQITSCIPPRHRMKYVSGHNGDEKLLRYLYEHKHFTPFEMGGLTIEVQAPIFVFREWHRHRTQSYNELSARYTPIPDLNYIPTIERLMLSSGANKQAQSTGAQLDENDALFFQHRLRETYADIEDVYQRALKDGVPKELARCVLPVARYSRMRASANLRNWLHFLTLRTDNAAQWEIRQYANIVATMIKNTFPHTYDLFKG